MSDLARYYDQSYPPSLWEGGSSTAISINPATGAVGASFTITVTGTGFTADSTIVFDGDPRVTTLVSPTQITAPIGALVAPARTVQVVVDTGGSRPFTITSVTVRESPSSFTIAEIQAWVDEHPDEADEVLAAEQASPSPRVTLVDWLEGFISHRDEGTIP
jgi:hypothetical protein